ncbi:hypothetical protein V1520DRAFT_343534 [Lipomyces starkeyi]
MQRHGIPLWLGFCAIPDGMSSKQKLNEASSIYFVNLVSCSGPISWQLERDDRALPDATAVQQGDPKSLSLSSHFVRAFDGVLLALYSEVLVSKRFTFSCRCVSACAFWYLKRDENI